MRLLIAALPLLLACAAFASVAWHVLGAFEPSGWGAPAGRSLLQEATSSAASATGAPLLAAWIILVGVAGGLLLVSACLLTFGRVHGGTRLAWGTDLKAIKKKAQSLGVKKVYVEDLREVFVKDHVFPMLRGNAIYEGSYLLGTSIARPLIARRQIEIAADEGAEAVCHGATGQGNDEVRFELTYMALHPQIKVIAPWREWTMRSRREVIEYAEKHGIPVEMKKGKASPYSMDANLLHISYEGRILEDPWSEPEEDMWRWTVSPEAAPDTPTYLALTCVILSRKHHLLSNMAEW